MEAEYEIRIQRYFCLHQEADEVVNEYLNALAGDIGNDLLKARSPILKLSVKQIDAFVTNNLLTDKVADSQAPQSIVESVAETADDDNNV